MSGHSKWSTIKRQKAVTDAKRGAVFTRLGNQIAIAARSGTDPATNSTLAMVIEKAKAANMPLNNIERAIQRVADKNAAVLQEVLYEGYGPGGVLTTCATIRRHLGEGTTQLGAVAVFGPRNRRVAPFAELALGYYAAHMKDRIDIWDPDGRHLTNLSSNVSNTEGGVYARIGAGVEFVPWVNGPGLFVSALYRCAKLGIGPGDWAEWFNDRKGGEVVAGVRLR